MSSRTTRCGRNIQIGRRGLCSLLLLFLATASTSCAAHPPLALNGRPVTVRAVADAKPGASVPITITAPGPGFLSLGVYNAQGTQIRALTYALPVQAGAQTLAWDATTDLGVPVAPGRYAVRGVWFAKPPVLHFKMVVGLSGQPPYVQADGTGGWGGNLGYPTDVKTVGGSLLASFACVEDNLNTGVQLSDATGHVTRHYHTFFGWDIRLAEAVDGDTFYLAVADLGSKRLVIGKYSVGSTAGAILGDVPVGDHQTASGPWLGRWTTDVRGLAASGGRIYVPLMLDDKLIVMDAASGKVLHTVRVPSPRGVAVQDGRVYLLSGKKLLRLDADGEVQGAVVASGLDDPSGLAIGPNGEFLVSDRGASQQVKIFSPSGAPLRTVGVKGGRPRGGLFHPGGLLDPGGLTLGPDGNVWVTEANEDFMRLSVWNPQTGALQKEFFNTRISAGQGELSPDRTQMLFRTGDFGDMPGLTAYYVNLEKGKWYPAWHRSLPQDAMQQSDVLRGNTAIYGNYAKEFGGHNPYLSFADGQMVQATNGRTYLTGGDLSIYLFDKATARPKLAALLYTHPVEKGADGVYQGLYDQGPENWLAWSDLNGDGQISKDEVSFRENVPQMAGVSRLMGWELQPDLSLLMLCPQMDPATHTAKTYVVRRLAPRRVLPSGVPVYDWADVQDVVTWQVPSLAGGDGTKGPTYYYFTGLRVEGGKAYSWLLPNAGGDLKLPGIDGQGWWASRNWRQTPMAFDLKTGLPAWDKLGRRAPGRALPGEMYYPWNSSATVDGFVFVPDTLGQMWVWTEGGQYVGRLYHDQRDGVRDSDSLLVEETNVFAYKVNGRVYSAGGDEGVRVHEVDLPVLTPVDAGTVAVSAQTASAAIPWDPDGPIPGPLGALVAGASSAPPAPSARPTYVAHRLPGGAAITVDGVLAPSEWASAPAAPIVRGGQTVATIQALYDQTNLYLAYRVQDPNGLKNAGTELPLSPFTSGSYVDFDLGRDWTRPSRDDNRAGDVRVILARITGQASPDYQMGFWPVRPDGANPQTVRSPAAERHFDDVSPVPGLRFASRPTPDGYTVEVSAPLESLGLNPSVTPTVGFDASVAFANPEGTERREADHWAGGTEARVVDRPGSSALLPDTWGTLTFDRAPVQAARQ